MKQKPEALCRDYSGLRWVKGYVGFIPTMESQMENQILLFLLEEVEILAVLLRFLQLFLLLRLSVSVSATDVVVICTYTCCMHICGFLEIGDTFLGIPNTMKILGFSCLSWRPPVVETLNLKPTYPKPQMLKNKHYKPYTLYPKPEILNP